MAKGIRLPARAKAGRLELLGGDEYIEQLIRTGLGEPDSENPWNVNGLGEFMIYDINDSQVESEVRPKVEAIFKSLKRDQLAELAKGSGALRFVQDTEGERKLRIEYKNLENGARRILEVPAPSGG
jgi:hypothetical protein